MNSAAKINNFIVIICLFSLFFFENAGNNKIQNCPVLYLDYTLALKGSPQINFISPKIYNFKTITKDSIIRHKYVFENSGDKPLVINSVKASCQCTKTNLSKNVILPHDTAFVELILNTKGKNGYVRINSIVEANTEINLYKLSMNGNINFSTVL